MGSPPLAPLLWLAPALLLLLLRECAGQNLVREVRVYNGAGYACCYAPVRPPKTPPSAALREPFCVPISLRYAGRMSPTKGCGPPQVLYCNGTQVMLEGFGGAGANNMTMMTYTVNAYSIGFESSGSIYDPSGGWCTAPGAAGLVCPYPQMPALPAAASYPWGCPNGWLSWIFEPPLPLSCIDAIYMYPRQAAQAGRAAGAGCFPNGACFPGCH
jgi:hypothetical protein